MWTCIAGMTVVAGVAGLLGLAGLASLTVLAWAGIRRLHRDEGFGAAEVGRGRP